MKDYGFDRNNVTKFEEKLTIPAGCYVAKILGAKWEEGKNGNSDVIICQFDIAEGEYTDFYKKQYEANTHEDRKYKGIARIWCPKGDGSEDDKKAIRKYNTILADFEDSNPGFRWDGAAGEGQLRGKKIGVCLREKEYSTDLNGRHYEGFFTEFAWFANADRVREGKVKTPSPKYLSADQKRGSSSVGTDNSGFVSVPESTSEDNWLPFD